MSDREAAIRWLERCRNSSGNTSTSRERVGEYAALLLAELAAARRTQELADEDHGLIVERLEAELAAAREDRDEFAALIHRLQDKLAAAEAREAKLREALRAVCDVGDRAAVQVARAALADGEGET